MTSNVYEAFRQRFPADRSRPFIESAGGKIHTYRDLEQTCGRYEPEGPIPDHACSRSAGRGSPLGTKRSATPLLQ